MMSKIKDRTVAPKSPDSSTTEAVTLRAFERGDNPKWTIRMYRLFQKDGQLSRDFTAAMAKAATP